MNFRHLRHLIAGIVAAGACSLLFQGCDVKFYETCPPDREVGEWGVINTSHTFGEYDSLYYVVNPIGNIADTVYYNGNYTDSYYHSDPVRVMIRYTLDDSIQFNLHRLYSTQINPLNIIMKVKEVLDTVDVKGHDLKKEDRDVRIGREVVLYLRRGENNENLYKCGPDSLFKELLRGNRELRVTATNGPSSSETEGSQNYEFTLNPAGFDKALHMADSLSRQFLSKPAPAHKKKSLKLKL